MRDTPWFYRLLALMTVRPVWVKRLRSVPYLIMQIEAQKAAQCRFIASHQQRVKARQGNFNARWRGK